MTFKDFFLQLNIVHVCKQYNLPLWQCPQFLFVLMGGLTILSSMTAFVLGNRYIQNMFFIDLVVISLTIVMLIISFIVTQSVERLAEANRMKSEFVRIVSHQLRAPLTNFKWALELLAFKSHETENIRGLDILKENSDRMEELISDLLVISRIKEGTFTITETSVDLRGLVKEVAARLGPFAKAHNTEVIVESEEELPEIFTDNSQIKLVIEVLLENAITYSKDRGDVKVLVRKVNKGIRVAVEDKGVGIPVVDKNYIFKQFFRASNAIHHKPEGTGLGLFIAKSILKRLGGEIGFKSKEGEGSTFWFVLPIK